MNEPNAEEHVIKKSNKNCMGKGDGEGKIVIPSDNKVPWVERAHRPGRGTAFSEEARVNYNSECCEIRVL